MRRALAVAALVGAILSVAAWPAAAKGGPVGATITGPGLGGPHGSLPGGSTRGGSGGSGPVAGAAAVGTIVLRDPHDFEPSSENPLWQLASFSGLFTTCGACSGFIDTSPPRDRKALGPVYRITYFTGRCCANSVRQFLYPFAPGGPVTYTTSDIGGDWFLSSHRTGWWHADGRMGVLFLRALHDIGLPATNPVVAEPAAGSAAVAASEASSSATTWRLLLALGVLALLLVGGAVAARPKSPARPA
ncbi:MAG TPA: hypothetical protein VNN79_13920 [Actinomycetota bacterium]|nr:hypothetical protein [Actinomycetota bacterium]